MSRQVPMGFTRGARFADWVRDQLAAADSSVRRSLQQHPQAVRASDDPASIKTGWIKPPTPNKVLVFTEYGIGDPFEYEHVHEAFDKVGEQLRGLPGVDDAGWESINPAVHYFYVKPFPGDEVDFDVAANPCGGKRNPDFFDAAQVIQDGMARALWVTSYADWVENLDEDVQRRMRARGRAAGPGQDWDNCAPMTPPSAENAGRRLVGFFEQKNGVPITELLRRALEADGRSFPPKNQQYVELFGHYLAMQALGHGVSWFDDHKKFTIAFPHIEAHTPDGRYLSMSGGR